MTDHDACFDRLEPDASDRAQARSPGNHAIDPQEAAGRPYGQESPLDPDPAIANEEDPMRSGMAQRRSRAEQSRINGSRSHGPKTSGGKTASSRNAMKHGLTARVHLVLEDEDSDRFDALHEAVTGELRPEGVIEGFLAARMTAAMWRTGRAERMERSLLDNAGPLLDPRKALEARMFAAAMAHAAPRDRPMTAYRCGLPEEGVFSEKAELDKLERIGRYRRDAMAEFHRSLRALERLKLSSPESAGDEGPAALEASPPPDPERPAQPFGSACSLGEPTASVAFGTTRAPRLPSLPPRAHVPPGPRPFMAVSDSFLEAAREFEAWPKWLYPVAGFAPRFWLSLQDYAFTERGPLLVDASGRLVDDPVNDKLGGPPPETQGPAISARTQRMTEEEKMAAFAREDARHPRLARILDYTRARLREDLEASERLMLSQTPYIREVILQRIMMDKEIEDRIEARANEPR